jgi:hypothetical protein
MVFRLQERIQDAKSTYTELYLRLFALIMRQFGVRKKDINSQGRKENRDGIPSWERRERTRSSLRSTALRPKVDFIEYSRLYERLL